MNHDVFSSYTEKEDTAEMEDDDDEENNSFDVEKLLRERRQKDGIYYLVRWLGYSSRYDSWVHEIDVGQDLVDELHASSVKKNNPQKTCNTPEENDISMEDCK